MSLILSGTNGLSDVDGSAATPAIRGTDTNTGIFFPAADTIAFAEGGVEAMRLDSSGNLGLGVTPSAWGSFYKAIESAAASNVVLASANVNPVSLACNAYATNSGFLYKTTGAASLFNASNGSYQWNIAPSGTAGNAISFTQAMTLDASGNLLVGNTTASSLANAGRGLIESSGSADAAITVKTANTINGYLYSDGSTMRVAAGGTLPLILWTNSAERARIDSSGNLLVGTTTNSPSTASGTYIYGGSTTAGYFLNNATTTAGISLALFYSSYSTANQTKFEVTSEGNVKSRTNSYAGFSDERLKQNITPASSQWNDIKAYDVVKFQMKSEQLSDKENPWMLGVIAQQVEQVSPGLVDEDAKDGMKTVKYSILYMKAVKALQENMIRTETLESAIQEQQAIITQLQADVAALKGQA